MLKTTHFRKGFLAVLAGSILLFSVARPSVASTLTAPGQAKGKSADEADNGVVTTTLAVLQHINGISWVASDVSDRPVGLITNSSTGARIVLTLMPWVRSSKPIDVVVKIDWAHNRGWIIPLSEGTPESESGGITPASFSTSDTETNSDAPVSDAVVSGNSGVRFFSLAAPLADVAAVPEPSSLLELSAAFLLAAGIWFRQHRLRLVPVPFQR